MSTLPQPRSSAPTLGQQHHPWHDDERKGQQFDDGESCLQPGTPGDAPGVEGEDRVWRGDHTATAAAHAQHMQEKNTAALPALGMPGRRLCLYKEDARGERYQKILQCGPVYSA